jgi:DNA polymerase III subunit delta
VKANAGEMARALDAPSDAVRLYLLYGPDEAGANALAKRLERAMGADAERVDLSGSTLKDDPARLADEAASISLFGGKRWIRIQPAGEDTLIAIQGLLQGETAGNPVVAIAGAIKATTALVKLALDSPLALVHTCYLPEERDAIPMAIALAREVGLRLAPDAARAIASSAANDRALMAQEIEKLSLFLDSGPDRPMDAGLDALEQIAAESNEGELGTLVDAVMSGRGDGLAEELARLSQSGMSGIPILRAIARRTQLLASLRAEIEGGRDAKSVVEARGKAIFWKEKAAITRQASRWDSARLATVMSRVLNAERALKSPGAVGELLADQELVDITRVASRLR